MHWLIGLELVLSVGAFGGAIGLVGGGLDLKESVSDLPFASPVFAGLALGLLVGVVPLAVAVGAWRRASWADLGHLAVGVGLVAWIVVQVAYIGFGSALQVIYLLWGLAILGLGLRCWRYRRA